ncbi:MAG: hypothetical protein AB1757_11425 [Acidobacteriota bacterium]
MKSTFELITLLALVFGGALMTSAQDMPPQGPPPGMQMRQFPMPTFADFDKNKDKKISKEEFQAQVPSFMADRFDRLDTNKDGFLDEAEWNAVTQGGFRGPRTGETLVKFLDANSDSNISTAEFAKILVLFDSLDKDKNGELTIDEGNEFFRALNQTDASNRPAAPPQGQMNRQMPTFADMDKNKDKKLGKDELPNPMMMERFDTNKDGFIDEAEWNTGMQSFRGPRTGETLVKFLDANGDSKLSKDEFAKMVSSFNALDKDKNGEITAEEGNEFNRVLTQLASEVANKATGGVDVTQLFTNLDKNKDGKITADELTSEKTFKALDLNGDGSITKEEATEALKKQAERKKAASSQN